MNVYVVSYLSDRYDSTYTDIIAVCDNREDAMAKAKEMYEDTIKTIKQNDGEYGISVDSMKCRNTAYGFEIADTFSGAKDEWVVSEHEIQTSNK